ncbi:hypothetical protein GCM10023238_13860 [Streptomyces heliomycini]
MNGESNLHPSVESWLLKLSEEDPVSADLMETAIGMLAVGGPAAGQFRKYRGADPVRLRPPAGGGSPRGR